MNINSISSASFSGGKIRVYSNSRYREETNIDVDNIKAIDKYGLKTKEGGSYVYFYKLPESDKEINAKYQQVLSAYAALQNPSRNNVTIDLT